MRPRRTVMRRVGPVKPSQSALRARRRCNQHRQKTTPVATRIPEPTTIKRMNSQSGRPVLRKVVVMKRRGFVAVASTFGRSVGICLQNGDVQRVDGRRGSPERVSAGRIYLSKDDLAVVLTTKCHEVWGTAVWPRGQPWCRPRDRVGRDRYVTDIDSRLTV